MKALQIYKKYGMYVLLAVESLAYRGDRHIAAQRDILHRDHRHPLPPWRFVLCVNFAGR